MALFDDSFLESLAALGKNTPRFKWYLSTIVVLAALNYPEEIPEVYRKLLRDYIPEDKKFEETRKIREALTKICGIQGAAKTGNSHRALASAVPPELRDNVNYRENDTAEVAFERGKALMKRIYGPNPSYDSSRTANASPDYYHIVSNLFYGYIFSFNEILNDLETGQAIISCLIGIDCQEQVENHMKGMLYNGASREEVQTIRETCLKVAEKLNVKFKSGPVAIPTITTPE